MAATNQDLSALQKEVSIALSKYIASFSQHLNSKVSYSFSLDQPLHYSGDLLEIMYIVEFNAEEDFKREVETNEKVAEAYGGHVAKGLPKAGYKYTAHGDSNFKAKTNVLVQQAAPDDEKFVFEGQDMHFEKSPSNFSLQAVSVNNQPYREFMQNPDIIREELSESLKEGLEEAFDFTPKSIRLKANQSFINPQDIKQLEELVDEIDSDIKAIENADVEAKLSKVIGEPISKKAEQAEKDGGYSLDSVRKIVEESVLEDIVQNVRVKEMSNYVRRLRSPELRQALGTSVNSYHFQINECLEVIKRHASQYEDLLYVSQEQLEETSDKILNTIIYNTDLLLDMLEASRKAYASFVE